MAKEKALETVFLPSGFLRIPSYTTGMNAEGYVSDVIYTSHFFREQAPVVLNEVRRLRNLPEVPLSVPFTWCDLGCGTGYTAAVLAAANPTGHFWGVDFLPAHIEEARKTAGGLTNVTFVESGFAEWWLTAQQAGLTFDFITLHGVMSYVKEETRLLLQQMVQSLLKPDGTLYVSYNAEPGWAATAPVQRLLRTLAEGMPGTDSAQRLTQAAHRALALEKAGAAYFQQVPSAGERLEAVLAADSNYPVHEYMSQQWHAFHHAEIAACFAASGRVFLGSATMAENYPEHLLPPAQWALLRQEKDPACREMLRDFMVNTTFRRDVFGPASPAARPQELSSPASQWQFLPALPAAQWKKTLRTPAGLIDPQLAAAFPAAGQWTDLSPPLAECALTAGLPLDRIHAAASFLVQTGQAFWITDPHADPVPAQQFNLHMVRRVLQNQPAEAFALPRCGTGISTGLLERLAICSHLLEGHTTAAAIAGFLEETARRLGRTLRHQGTILQDRTARLAMLEPFASRFLHQRWPLLKRWQVL